MNKATSIRDYVADRFHQIQDLCLHGNVSDAEAGSSANREFRDWR